MENPFIQITMTAENLLMKAAGKRLIADNPFMTVFPDQKFNEMMNATWKHIESRLAHPFGVRFRKRWLRMAGENSANSVETAFASMWLCRRDPALALELIENFTANATSEGRIPVEMNVITGSTVPAYPWLAAALNLWVESADRRTAAKPAFMVLNRNADWLSVRCRREDGLYHISDSDWFDRDPTSGPVRRADAGARELRDRLQLVGFNALIIWQARLMSRTAMLMDNVRDAKKYEAVAGRFSKDIHIALWDESQGFYFDRAGDRIYDLVSATSFLPLAAEAPTRHQSARLVEKLSALTEELPVLISRPENAPLVYAVIDGLNRYGYRREASALAMSLSRAAMVLPKDRAFLPCLVAGEALLESVVGFHRYPDRYVLNPSLPNEWEGGVVTVRDGQRTLRFTLQPGGCVSVELRGPGMPAEPVTIQNHSFRNILFNSEQK